MSDDLPEGPHPPDRPQAGPDSFPADTGSPLAPDLREEAAAQGLDPEEIDPLYADEDALRRAQNELRSRIISPTTVTGSPSGPGSGAMATPASAITPPIAASPKRTAARSGSTDGRSAASGSAS